MVILQFPTKNADSDCKKFNLTPGLLPFLLPHLQSMLEAFCGRTDGPTCSSAALSNNSPTAARPPLEQPWTYFNWLSVVPVEPDGGLWISLSPPARWFNSVESSAAQSSADVLPLSGLRLSVPRPLAGLRGGLRIFLLLSLLSPDFGKLPCSNCSWSSNFADSSVISNTTMDLAAVNNFLLIVSISLCLVTKICSARSLEASVDLFKLVFQVFWIPI